MLKIYSQASFFEENMYWLIPVGIIALLCIIVAIYSFIRGAMLSKEEKEDSKKTISLAEKSEYLEYLGGEDNIVEENLKGSRITVKLKDIEKANPEKLLEAGVTSYIKMADKIVLIVKDHAEEVYNRIFK